MAGAYRIIPGTKFNRLTLLCEAPKINNHNRRVSALCECGTAKTYILSAVIHGYTKSCGCAHMGAGATHGHTKRRKMSPEYYSWASMITRCNNPRSNAYKDYGGRGIKVCTRWRVFANFLADMGERPRNTTLERLDFDGDYEPANCIWTDKKRQSNNRRSNHVIEHEGETLTISQWSDRCGIAYNTFHARVVRLGWPMTLAMSKPPRRSRYTLTKPA